MPRIPDSWLNSIVFMYESEDDARAGADPCGTGCLMYQESDSAARVLYVVTNDHVARGVPAPVPRVTLENGESDALPLLRSDWVPHPHGDDLAVAVLGVRGDFLARDAIPVGLCLHSMEDDQRIGPGTEVFYMGMLDENPGTRRNLPVVRFGNIAMLPLEPVRHPYGIDQDSYLVEARSIGGFSGSPVFADPAHFYHEDTGHTDFYMKAGMRLLGFDWCHLSRNRKVLEADGETPVSEGWVVKDNTGIMCVVPAWKLLELLEDVEVTKRVDKYIAAHKEEVKVTLDATTRSEFDRFEDLARRLVHVPKTEIDQKRSE